VHISVWNPIYSGGRLVTKHCGCANDFAANNSSRNFRWSELPRCNPEQISRGFHSKMGIVEEECDEAAYWIEVILDLGFVPEKCTKELLWKQTKF
jgi:hypothetical protein